MQVGNSFFGADIEGVRQVAKSLATQAANINSAITHLNKVLADTHWTGPDHDRFVSQWQGTYAPQIKKAATDLQQTSGQVNLQINAQERASNS